MNISVPSSIMLPFIDTHQVDPTSKYQSFEFVLANYIPEGETFLEPKLSRVEMMISRYFMKHQCELGIGLGKFGEGILVPI